MRIAVFGANGPTGRQVTRQALAEGHTVTAVTRRPESFPLRDPRLRVTGADVLDPAGVGRVVAGQEAVISTLGASRSENPVSVYSRGVTHLTRAMAGHGVPRPVCVTSVVLFGEKAPGESLLFRKVLKPLSVRFLGRRDRQRAGARQAAGVQASGGGGVRRPPWSGVRGHRSFRDAWIRPRASRRDGDGGG